jgi:toxin-antitoxin system PIN domain toxin
VILLDVNVLVYAFRKDASHHGICKPWLDNVVKGDERFGLSSVALSAVVRITTSKRLYQVPSAIHEAFAFCDNLLGQPHSEIVSPGERHWAIFHRMCTATGVTGPDITDAWFAALAIEHGCTWITFDRDFARFPGLNWREPAI